MNTQYSVDADSVIFEEIDNEMVVINLQTGCYYSLNRDAALAWRLVSNGFAISDILELGDGGQGEERLGATLQDIVRDFEAEQLLHKASSAVDRNHAAIDGLDPAAILNPSMQKHEDIQEMLKLDPIHEVTDLGWPHKNS